jgi:hypothetical protein
MGHVYVHACADLRKRKKIKGRDTMTDTESEEALTAEAVRMGLPLHMRVDRTAEEIGSGHSKVYELLGDGEFEAVKSGRSLLVKTWTVLRYIRSLPPAQIAPSLRAARRRNAASGGAPR